MDVGQIENKCSPNEHTPLSLRVPACRRPRLITYFYKAVQWTGMTSMMEKYKPTRLGPSGQGEFPRGSNI